MNRVTDRTEPATDRPRTVARVLPTRLAALYLRSRHVPAALGLLAGLAGLLWAALRWNWTIAGGAAAQQLVPLTIEAGAASVIAVATYGPFGEPERATGRWLPYLRPGTAVLLTMAAFGLFCAGATGGVLAGGTPALLRNTAGSAGIGLAVAGLLGGQFGWIGPLAYWLVTESALAAGFDAPYLWSGRSPHNAAATAWAVAAVVTGVVMITVRSASGPRRLA